MKMATSQVVDSQKGKVKRAKSKRFYLFVFAAMLLCGVGSGTSFTVYQMFSANYHGSTALAQTGVQQLRSAEALLTSLPKHPFDTQAVNQAQLEFTAAMTAFRKLDGNLRSFPGISTFIPVYGTRLSAALHLASLAIDLSQAGIAGCTILNLLITRIHDPLDTQGQGLTMVDLGTISQDFQRIKLELNLAVDQADQVQPTDLQFDPGLSKMFGSFRREIPTLQAGLHDAEQLLTVAPILLGVGSPTNYLLEILDSTELRPAGGFIGNYGIATISGGHLMTAHITDVDLLDKPFKLAGNRIAYPPAYKWFSNYLAGDSWSFRDSNLDADFPTAASYGELNYIREGGKGPLQGVIAITPAFIQQVLTITGPIDVPEYQESVTAQNLIDRIHYYQLGPGHGSDLIPSPDGHSSLRKRFTELLTEHLLARVRQLPASGFSQLLQLMINSLHSKNLQIYFNSAAAENVLQDLHLNAAIQSPVGDGLFVVDANVAADKANMYIINSLYDQVTIDAEGNAIHHTTISYAWTMEGPIYGPALYQDYVRVYVPTNSNLLVQNGWRPSGTSEAFDREVWAGFFTLNYGQKRTITLIWTAPGVASKDANGWHYQYEIQRQAGAQWSLHLSITLPSCAVMKNEWGGLASSNRESATLTQPLNEDTNVGINYTC
jgi:hypothetical protein